MRRCRRGGRRRDASPKTLRGGGRSGRSDARGRAREATRALDPRARSRRGCVGARGSESATRDVSAGRDGNRGTPRRRGDGARVGGAVRAEDARSTRPAAHVELALALSPRAIRRRRSRSYRGNRDCTIPRTLAAMDPSRVTSSIFATDSIEDSSTARESRTVTWTRSRRGSIASPSRTPFSATISRRFDFSSKSRRIVRVVDAPRTLRRVGRRRVERRVSCLIMARRSRGFRRGEGVSGGSGRARGRGRARAAIRDDARGEARDAFGAALDAREKRKRSPRGGRRDCIRRRRGRSSESRVW